MKAEGPAAQQPAPGIGPGPGTGGLDVRDLAIVLGLLAVSVVIPIIVGAAAGTNDIPRNDDWSYARDRVTAVRDWPARVSPRRGRGDDPGPGPPGPAACCGCPAGRRGRSCRRGPRCVAHDRRRIPPRAAVPRSAGRDARRRRARAVSGVPRLRDLVHVGRAGHGASSACLALTAVALRRTRSTADGWRPASP